MKLYPFTPIQRPAYSFRLGFLLAAAALCQPSVAASSREALTLPATTAVASIDDDHEKILKRSEKYREKLANLMREQKYVKARELMLKIEKEWNEDKLKMKFKAINHKERYLSLKSKGDERGAAQILSDQQSLKMAGYVTEDDSYMETMNPAWNMCKSVLLTRTVSNDKDRIMVWNPMQAFQLLAENKNEGSNWPLFTGFNYDNIRTEEAEALIQESYKKDDADYYKQTVELLRNTSTPVPSQLIAHYDEALYRNVLRERSIESCNNYLSIFQQPSHKQEITDMRDDLVIKSMGKTVKACNDFLAKYPTSSYINNVKQLREQYGFNDMLKTPSIAGWTNYIENLAFTQNYKQKGLDQLYGVVASQSATYEDLQKVADTYGFAETKAGYEAKTVYQSIIYSSRFFKNMGFKHQPQSVTQESEKGSIVYYFNKQGLLYSKIDGIKDDLLEINYTFSTLRGWTAEDEFKSDNGSYSRTSDDGSSEDRYDNWLLMERKESGGVSYSYTYDYRGNILRVDKYQGSTQIGKATFEYEYNEWGDWTLQQQYDDEENLTEMRTRSYNY